jgi:hypothetical protein
MRGNLKTLLRMRGNLIMVMRMRGNIKSLLRMRENHEFPQCMRKLCFLWTQNTGYFLCSLSHLDVNETTRVLRCISSLLRMRSNLNTILFMLKSHKFTLRIQPNRPTAHVYYNSYASALLTAHAVDYSISAHAHRDL